MMMMIDPNNDDNESSSETKQKDREIEIKQLKLNKLREKEMIQELNNLPNKDDILVHKYNANYHAQNPHFNRILHHQAYKKLKKGFWNTITKIACWYCGHNFNHYPMGMPKERIATGQFKCSGIYCSPVCIKSKIVYEFGFYEANLLGLLTLMLSDVYNYNGLVFTIEKECFVKYGGYLIYEKFLIDARNGIKPDFVIRGEPFVSDPIFFEAQFKSVDTSLESIQARKPKKQTNAHTPLDKDDQEKINDLIHT